jgi:dTDP-4-amino-4,6-dideoxygalactose transaminase
VSDRTERARDAQGRPVVTVVDAAASAADRRPVAPPAAPAVEIPAPRFVPFTSPSITTQEVDAVSAVLQSGWLTTGPRVREFEAAIAGYTGARYAVALNSCTAALHLSLLAAGIGPGDEVITTPLTFCATANAIIHTGARPVLADIDRETMNLDPDAVAAAITDHTAAILPVHYAGRPVDVPAFRSLASRHGLVLIEDAAHAMGGAINGRRIGSIADLTCFSFHATKNLTTGEGGMVTTDSAEWADRIRVAALHGMSRDGWTRYAREATPHYDVVQAGFKYNMMDIQAALGLQQFARFEAMQQRRGAIWAAYDAALASLPVTRPRPPLAGTTHARHLYTILVDETECGYERDALFRELRTRGIGTSVHFKALHLHPYYTRHGYRRGMFPNAEMISDRTLSLPLAADMRDEDVRQVIDALTELLG